MCKKSFGFTVTSRKFYFSKRMVAAVLGVSLLVVCLTYMFLTCPTQAVIDPEPKVDRLWIMSALLNDDVQSLNRKKRQATTPTTTIATTRTTANVTSSSTSAPPQLGFWERVCKAIKEAWERFWKWLTSCFKVNN